MDEVEVDKFELEFLQTCIDSLWYVCYVWQDLGCDEELRTLNFTLFDGNTHFTLGVIDFSIVKMSIT